MVCHFDDTLAEMSGQPRVMHVYICMATKHKSKKDRRHSGRYYPKIIKPNMKYSDIIIEALDPKSEYDEWISWRDSMRDYEYYLWKKRDKKKSHKVTKAKFVVT